MSILIKGIDIPKCSNEDILVVIRRNKAEVLQTGYKERTVEAIQIPTPHGRLIDADKLESHEEFDGYGFTKSVYADDINEAPTILEAEE